MSFSRTVALVVGATAVVASGVAIGAVQTPTLSSGSAVKKDFGALPKMAEGPNGATEPLFRGDMLPDLGLGCSNGTGTTGGPNDWATKVTSTLTPPYGIASTTYNIFTFNSGTTWNLMVWNNGATPGTVVGQFNLGQANGTVGNHTVPLVPGNLTIPAAAGTTWFFGLSQGANTNGVRIGMDNSGSVPATVYIRAPGCGLAAFGTVESIGFPGFWVHRIIVDQGFPVELMDYSVS